MSYLNCPNNCGLYMIEHIVMTVKGYEVRPTELEELGKLVRKAVEIDAKESGGDRCERNRSNFVIPVFTKMYGDHILDASSGIFAMIVILDWSFYLDRKRWNDLAFMEWIYLAPGYVERLENGDCEE